MNVRLAREMAARAEAARRKTLTFFTHRTVAAAAQVKRMVDEGFLGTPLHVSGLYFTASHLRENKPLAWKMQRAESGTGVLGDIGSHVIDLARSEEHTSELQSQSNLVCRLLLEKKKTGEEGVRGREI